MPELLVLKTAFGMPKLKGLRSMLSRPSASGRLIPSIECRKVAGCVRLRNSVDDPELNQLLPSVHVIAAKHTWLSYRSGLTRFSVQLLLGPADQELRPSAEISDLVQNIEQFYSLGILLGNQEVLF